MKQLIGRCEHCGRIAPLFVLALLGGPLREPYLCKPCVEKAKPEEPGT